MKKLILPCHEIEGHLVPPADKSVSHRAAILNSLAKGEAMIDNFSEGADCKSTLNCLKAMGVAAEKLDPINGEERLRIVSPGLANFMEPSDVLNAQNSGTTMRFLMGLLGSTSFCSVITGDKSLRTRPMKRIVDPLRLMGAQIMGRGNDSLAPLTIRGGDLNGIEYALPVASAQLKSSLTIAALSANGETTLHQPAQSRDHTERMLSAMGASIRQEGKTLRITPCQNLNPVNIRVSGDISSASFWIVAAIAHPKAKIRLDNVGINPTRSGIVDVLQNMGANISLINVRSEGGEPVSDMIVESSDLVGVDIDKDIIPIIQDEIPILALAACFAKGNTVIRDAEELRYKESDRLNTTAVELSKLGAKIKEYPDGLLIEGTGTLSGGSCKAHNDHRIAMMLGIAGLLAKDPVTITGSEVVDISYPHFWSDLENILKV